MSGMDVKRIGEAATVLCIGAHCDDIEIGCGGTLLKWARERPATRFVWAVFAGEAARQVETRAAAAGLLGGTDRCDLRLFGFRESRFPSQYDRIKDVFEMLKDELQPDVILTHRREDRHQDHALLAELTWNTFRAHFVLEYEIPKYEGDLAQPNAFVPLTAKDLDRKVQVLTESFRSQAGRAWFTSETFRGLARLRGIECAAPGGYAEGFHVRKMWL